MNRKLVFDAVRRLLGRGFRRGEIRTLDRALDRALEGGLGAPVFSAQDSVTCVTPFRIGPAGMNLIKQFEGCARRRADGLVEAYPDPGTGGDPWTIGWGATGPGIAAGTAWTQDECDRRLAADLERYAAEVAAAIGDAPTTQNQFDAMVSFHYNTGAIARATLTRRHREGRHAEAAAEFARWIHAGGRVMRGLERRRRAEAVLYRS